MKTGKKAVCRALADQFPGRWNREYCYWKLRTDPLYPAASAALLEADDAVTPVLDIGCGLGLFARYLREAGFRAPIRGFDYDGRKIAAAKAMQMADSTLEFREGDVREALPDFSGHVTILDVLQYLTEEQQAELLRQVSAAIAPGARLVIRSGLGEATWRFRLTRVADWFAHGCFWMKGRPIHYPDKGRTEQVLAEAGLTGAFTPLWGRTPFNNYLGVFRRAA